MAADVADLLEALAGSSSALDHSIADLTDEQAREASLLPGWSRGHVLTHVARNADGLVNLATWARTGVETPMYPSREKRNADIEAGAGRPAAELVVDVRDSHQRLMSALDDMHSDDWDRPIRLGGAGRPGTGSDILRVRRTEVEVHHVDLDLDYTIAHWPEDFVAETLVQVCAEFSDREGVPGFTLRDNDGLGEWPVAGGGPAISGPSPSLLGWLLGRTDGVGLHSDSNLPKLEAWR